MDRVNSLASQEIHKLHVAAPVSTAHPRTRHRVMFLGFISLVCLPVIATAAYLWLFASDQYVTTIGFSVRQEEAPTATSLLVSFAGISPQSASDTDILYTYLQSSDLVARLDKELNLAEHFSEPRSVDPLLAFNGLGTIESLTRYWSRMSRLAYDPGTGLIELQIRAFDPETAKAIADAVLEQSSELINGLSVRARDDAVRYAEEELQAALRSVVSARQRLTTFRANNQIVDPSSDLQGRMGLISELQARLAEELIAIDLLSKRTDASDLRLAERRNAVAAIEARIASERLRIGAGQVQTNQESYARLVEEYSSLSVELQIAEEIYSAARLGIDVARAEARRKSRYLAVHVRPHLAERATAPNRLVIVSVISFFLFLVWALASLIFLSLRDRRQT